MFSRVESLHVLVSSYSTLRHNLLKSSSLMLMEQFVNFFEISNRLD